MQTIVGFRRKDGRTFLLDELFLKYKDTLPTSTAWNVLLLDFQLPREHVCATNPTCFPNHFWCQNDHLPFNLFPAQKHFLQGLWAVSTCYELTFKKWGGTCKWRSMQQRGLSGQGILRSFPVAASFSGVPWNYYGFVQVRLNSHGAQAVLTFGVDLRIRVWKGPVAKQWCGKWPSTSHCLHLCAFTILL